MVQHDKQKRYIIYAPVLSNSMGVRVLYHLHDVLKKHGYEALIFCPDKQLSQYTYIDRLDIVTRKHDIVIYPEVVKGNPLGFNNVVRYVLFFPGKLGGNASYNKQELVVSWSREYYARAPLLSFDLTNTQLFHDAGLPKTQDCVFIHKRGKWKEVKELDGLVEITMEYPSTQEELAQLLKTTGTLYSYDHNSALLDEALLCGAKVKLVCEDGFSNYISKITTHEEQAKQLNTFIQLTQLHQGKIEYTTSLKRNVCIQKIRLKIFVIKYFKKLFSHEQYKRKILHYEKKLAHLGVPVS